jgi:hypothetical protein
MVRKRTPESEFGKRGRNRTPKPKPRNAAGDCRFGLGNSAVGSRKLKKKYLRAAHLEI